MNLLKNQGYKIVATTPHTEAFTINNLPLEQPLAIFFGTEQEGLSESVLQVADYQVKIPMFGFTESFNISVSVAILLNTLRKRLVDSDIEWKLSQEEQTDLKIEWCKKILRSGQALENEFNKQLLKKDL
jgi:tRNA (guanosine-2'-O-)-methyltransferase